MTSRVFIRHTLGWVLLLPFEYAMGPAAPLIACAWVEALVLIWSY